MIRFQKNRSIRGKSMSEGNGDGGDDDKPISETKGGENFWDSVSDEELLATELTTDDPERLEGLVTALPDDYRDSYMEYSYDLRGSGREEFVCVHGHHKHLCGFVMRKGDQRWQGCSTLCTESQMQHDSTF
jgi:hypothetical protein